MLKHVILFLIFTGNIFKILLLCGCVFLLSLLSCEIIPYGPEIIADNTGVIPDSSNVIPDSSNVILGNSEVTPGNSKVISDNSGIVLHIFNNPPDEKFEFAAGLLKNYFIFPERLPATEYEFFSFSSPEALYGSVNEKYTAYFNAENAKVIKSYLSTDKYGIGISMESVDIGYLIKYIFSDSPGEKAGLKPLDTLIAVDGKSTEGITIYELQQLLRGEKNSSVVLHVKRKKDFLKITVTRGLFKVPTVFIDVIGSSVVSIMLTGFLPETNTPGGSATEFYRALDSTKWANYIILDLRKNGGGLLGQCFDITSMMVPPETEIISTHERRYNPATNTSFFFDTTYISKGTGIAADRTIYVLVDSETASASEVLVSCIMQRSNVTVIGEVTYGKARGQVIAWGPDSVFAKVTCMIITPLGNSAVSYDNIGITPDILTPSENAFNTALDMIYKTSIGAKRTAAARRPHRKQRLWCDVPLHHTEPKAFIHVAR